jgi:hypothetical protein
MQDVQSARLLRLILTGMLVVCVWTAALGAAQSPSEAQPDNGPAADMEQAAVNPRADDAPAEEPAASSQEAAAQADVTQGDAASPEVEQDLADQDAAAPPVEFIPPAECRTGQVELTPVAQGRPYWLFVMNFDVVRTGRPMACVLVYHAGAARPFDAISIPCVRVGRGIGLRDGQATFSGGSLRCDINLQRQIAGLNGMDIAGRQVVLSASNAYQKLTILGVGALDPVNGRVEPYGNPLLFYQPNRRVSPVGLFAPLADQTTPPAYSLLARANGRNYRSEGCSSDLKGVVEMAGGTHAWSMLYGIDQPGVLELRADDQTLCRFKGVAPISFRADGGSFRIGGSTLGGTLRGTLDEIVLDPTGGTRPPGSK